MKQICIALLSLISINSFAQTKAIAFKSHSGTMTNFDIALSNALFDTDASNFGTPPVNKNSYRLVSVTYLSKSKVVLVKKTFTRKWGQPEDSARFTGVKSDTLYNNPLFSQRHSLDSIKEVLKISGEYNTPVNEITFIGYDNNKLKGKKSAPIKNNDKPKENSIPTVVTPSNDAPPASPFDTAMIKALAGILLLAFTGGWLSWKYGNYLTKKQNRNAGQLAVV